MSYNVQNIIAVLPIRTKKELRSFICSCLASCKLLVLLALTFDASAQTPTTTTLTTFQNPSCLNEAVVLTATVDNPAATGIVRFYDGITVLGEASLNAGAASLSVSTLTAGVHNNITATYFGVAPFNGSSSTAIVHTVNSPPGFSVQPSPQTAGIGCTVSFAASATGTAPFTYQWRKNGIEITGATDDTYPVINVALSDASDYDVVITNSCGTVVSTAASLSINPSLTPGSINTSGGNYAQNGNHGVASDCMAGALCRR